MRICIRQHAYSTFPAFMLILHWTILAGLVAIKGRRNEHGHQASPPRDPRKQRNLHLREPGDLPQREISLGDASQHRQSGRRRQWPQYRQRGGPSKENTGQSRTPPAQDGHGRCASTGEGKQRGTIHHTTTSPGRRPAAGERDTFECAGDGNRRPIEHRARVVRNCAQNSARRSLCRQRRANTNDG